MVSARIVVLLATRSSRWRPGTATSRSCASRSTPTGTRRCSWPAPTTCCRSSTGSPRRCHSPPRRRRWTRCSARGARRGSFLAPRRAAATRSGSKRRRRNAKNATAAVGRGNATDVRSGRKRRRNAKDATAAGAARRWRRRS
ncbi:Globulin-1 S allele [Zea mays]|uniref:Globulin-1 S allele n=1 Tax=Zea mays TaxID=4577 RepID=A0A1D6KYZ9_MAIZE|nr:Globulin-1 S allele [Zea mays]